MTILRIAEVEEMSLNSYSEEQRHQILTYMLLPDFRHYMSGPSTYVDQKTHRETRTAEFYSRDDQYSWTDTDFFLFRDYLVDVPHDFAEHIFDFYRNGGQLKRVLDCDTFGRIEHIRFSNYARPHNDSD